MSRTYQGYQSRSDLSSEFLAAMTNTRNQEIANTLKSHDKAITDIQAALSALMKQQEQLFKQQEEILKAVRDKPTSATVPSPPPAAEALHTPAPPTSVSATQPKSALTSPPKPTTSALSTAPNPTQNRTPLPVLFTPNPAPKRALLPTPLAPKRTLQHATSPSPRLSSTTPTPASIVVCNMLKKVVHCLVAMAPRTPITGVAGKHAWRPPWRLMERDPIATVQVEWRPPWFTKSYPDFSSGFKRVECYGPNNNIIDEYRDSSVTFGLCDLG